MASSTPEGLPGPQERHQSSTVGVLDAFNYSPLSARGTGGRCRTGSPPCIYSLCGVPANVITMTELYTSGGVADNAKPSWPLQLWITIAQNASTSSILPGHCFPQTTGPLDVDRRRQQSIGDPAINRSQGDGYNLTKRKPYDDQGRKSNCYPLDSGLKMLVTISEHLRMGVCRCRCDRRLFHLHMEVRSNSRVRRRQY